MTNIIEIKERAVKERLKPTVTYWKYSEPEPIHPANWFGSGYELVGDEYMGFVLCQSDRQFTLFEIKTKELGIPPVRLRGYFTSKQKAKECIEAFHKEEEREKQIALAKRDQPKIVDGKPFAEEGDPLAAPAIKAGLVKQGYISYD